ncbi:DUF502 domain-containing protein [Alkaliphilus peptidifermentans]|uniref:Uncharacterized membrane protein n=1 Tax=Alkaliphilus peptidifermentans DSM 18978 TaxID=1120976 RepID=A0A1G5BUN6_9FIRM|nr:DUF502 domain-containing protein [Alkaliphilus peptidifermentans]SCX93787.1 Uncharacterized membrane protein [Alkaliphilus peptidifermentans DSM 18978]
MWKDIRKTFFTGLLVILPMALTMILIIWIFNRVDIIFREPIENIIGFRIYGLGVLITLVLVFSAGIIARNYSGYKMITFTEIILRRIPLVRTLYFSIKQLTETLYGSKNTAFRQAVLIEYPSKGIYTIGFITSDAAEEIQEKTDENVVGLFIPTTPNPTSGMFVMVSKNEVVPLNMTVEEAVKLIVSGGIVKPGQKNQ